MASIPGTLSGRTRRQQLEATAAQLMLERSSFDAHWTEIADYLAPKRPRFTVTDRNRGDRRSALIIDSDPRFAARTLQSGLHAGITSPSRPWFRLTTPDPDLAEHGDVKLWLHTVTQRMHTVFLRSNVYNVLPVLYGDLSLFATAAMSIIEDDEDMLRAYSYPLGSFAFGCDKRGVANTFVHYYRRTVRQLIEEFGYDEESRTIDWSKFSVTVKSHWDQGNLEMPIDCTWMVTPNDRYDPTKMQAKFRMPWLSAYFETGRANGDWPTHDQFLHESGFRTFPFLVPRWDVTGDDTYGTDCPGMIALGDVKQLQYMQKVKAKGIAKAIDPPLKAHPNMRNQKVSLNPGDLTYTDNLDRQNGLSPIHEVPLQGIEFLIQDMGETRMRIERAFYADLFLMLARSPYPGAGQPVTAREIEERHEEKLLALGPVLERLNDELLDGLIDRTFDVMQAAGAIPPAPEPLQGLQLKVEYVSIMAQAQKLVGVVGHDRFLTTVVQLVPIAPEVADKVDFQQVVDVYADHLGINPKIVRPDKDAQAISQQRQQQQAAMVQAEQAKTMGSAAQSLAKAPLETGGTALDAVLRQRNQEPMPAGPPAA